MTDILGSFDPTIPDDHQYESQVLLLNDGRTEETLDEEIRQEAISFSIEPPRVLPEVDDGGVSPCVSSTTISTEPRRSDSASSRKSSSTGFTSIFSRHSRDYHPAQAFAASLRNFSRPSLHEQDGDEASDSSYPSSPISTRSAPGFPRRPSTTSSFQQMPQPQYTQRRPFSMRRGLSRLSRLRKPNFSSDETEISTCFYCGNNCPQAKPTFRLPCRHDICRHHLREIVVTALTSWQRSSLYCCGRLVPKAIIEAVSNRHEQERLCSILSSNPVGGPELHCSDRDLSGYESSQCRSHRTSISQSSITMPGSPHTTLAKRNLERALRYPDFAALFTTQENERDRFVNYQSERKNRLFEYQDKFRRQHKETQGRKLKEFEELQPQALAKLEDNHISAEMDLQKVQDQEKWQAHTKLRHMEAYCVGHDPEGTGRTVTEQDRKALERQYWVCDNLDQRHTSAINVLRQQQARQVKFQAEKQEGELSAMKRKQETEARYLERAFDAQHKDFEDIFLHRRVRMLIRWGLMTEIWRAKAERDDPSIGIGLPIAAPELPE